VLTFVDVDSGAELNLCFQRFDEELGALPGVYAAPRGRLILAQVDGRAAGCIALKPLEATICEMKRLYVRPSFRGRQLGAALVSRVIDDARAGGYRSMRSVGFQEIPSYYVNPLPNALYFELTF
jgi:putative acetyltransferase